MGIKIEGESDDESLPTLEDTSDVKYSVDGELLVVRRALSVQVKEDENIQCENIFHINCHVNNKVYNMMLDRGSCINVVSSSLVKKLNLTILKHPMPKLQWLNEL